MNTILNSNYQVGFGMKRPLKSPEVIQRKAKQAYQHLSPYILQNKYGSTPYIEKLVKSLTEFRHNLEVSENPLKMLIEHLKNGKKIGNSGEETILATVIGRINGQKNIYTGTIDGLDHAISFITRGRVENGQKIILNDKNTIIIDPQLGITDYANNYFQKLCNIIGGMPKKKTIFSVTPVHNYRLNKTQIAELRANYPELLIENYKATM